MSLDAHSPDGIPDRDPERIPALAPEGDRAAVEQSVSTISGIPAHLRGTSGASSPPSSTGGRNTRVSSPAGRQTSAPAIAATVALVMFSVFIGLYGPRLGNRQQLPGGTTLVELATAIEPRHAQRVIGVLGGGMEDIALLRRARGSDALAADARTQLEQARREAEQEIGRMLGVSILLPVPTSWRVLWGEPERVRLPGAGGAMVSCTLLPDTSGLPRERHATVLFLEDEDRYTVFDPYGRPRPMPEGEVFSVVTGPRGNPETDGATGSSVQVFRSGQVVVALQASDAELAAELVASLEESLARKPGDADAPQTQP